MAQGCLKCLKLTMCVTNLLCFLCGVVVLGLGIYLLVGFKMAALTPNLASAHMLIISGIVITCVSFLGFLGALKENRCLLLMFFLLLFCLMLLELTAACLLLVYEEKLGCCGVTDWRDWGDKVPTSCELKHPSLTKNGTSPPGCYEELKRMFESNFLTTGISVIVLCIVEVLGMCFAMTLYCHISRSGLGYKL